MVFFEDYPRKNLRSLTFSYTLSLYSRWCELETDQNVDPFVSYHTLLQIQIHKKTATASNPSLSKPVSLFSFFLFPFIPFLVQEQKKKEKHSSNLHEELQFIFLFCFGGILSVWMYIRFFRTDFVCCLEGRRREIGETEYGERENSDKKDR